MLRTHAAASTAVIVAVIVAVLVAVLAAASGAAGCHAAGAATAAAAADQLVIAAYTAPREAFNQGVIPAFREAWRRRTGRDVDVRASYLGSGAQTRAVMQGFEADVAVLALESDVDKIAKAGLVPRDWRARTGEGGIVARSLVVIAVRAGNPRGLHEFADLAGERLDVLTPNPRTSGGAMWNLVAMYGGAALPAASAAPGSPAAGVDLVRRVFANVSVMDKGARESLVNFERGIGDAAITYEQEVHVARRAGRVYDYVIPSRTVVIDIPAAVIEANARAHGRSEVAAAFVAFLRSRQAEPLLAAWGFRPVGAAFARPPGGAFPALAAGQTFRIDELGGWRQVVPSLFGPDGKLSRAIEAEQAAR